MATLSAGVLLKLLDGMKMGAAKPVGEKGTAVLQVTDIVPAAADMDKVGMFPKHGRIYIKVSDSSHSIYATLPPAQADLVLANKLSLGEFVHVDRLDPGFPFPVVVGARLIPGRHPLVFGTPDPAKKPAAPRRGSWGLENHGGGAGVLASPKVVTPIALSFEERTPVNERPSPTKSTSVMPRMMTRSRSLVADRGNPPPPPNKIPKSPFPEKSLMSCTAVGTMSASVMPSLVTRSRSFVADRGDPPPRRNKIPKSPFSEKNLMSYTAVRTMSKRAREEEPSSPDYDVGSKRATSSKRRINDIERIYKPHAPAACFDGFLSFRQEAAQTVAEIESIQQVASSMAAAAATLIKAAAARTDVVVTEAHAAQSQPTTAPPNVPPEITQNRTTTPGRLWALLGFRGLSKSASFTPGTKS